MNKNEQIITQINPFNELTKKNIPNAKINTPINVVYGILLTLPREAKKTSE